MSFESKDDESEEEITSKQSAPKEEDTVQEMTKLKTKTPKSALKPPGAATSTGKKVSIAVTSPDTERRSKKIVSTPHPSLTKKRHPEENEKENIGDENGVAATCTSKEDNKSDGGDKLEKKLSFLDEEEEQEEKKEKEAKKPTTVTSQTKKAIKRKLDDSSGKLK